MTPTCSSFVTLSVRSTRFESLTSRFYKKLLFVVDGRTLPVKHMTDSKRNDKRNWYLEKLTTAEDCSLEKLAVYEHYSTRIEKTLIYEVIDFLKFRNLEVLVAPYESDAQLAFLLRRGLVDYIMSEDSDMIAFGCRKIVKGFKIEGKCDILVAPSANSALDSEDDSSGILSAIFSMSFLTRQRRPKTFLHLNRL